MEVQRWRGTTSPDPEKIPEPLRGPLGGFPVGIPREEKAPQEPLRGNFPPRGSRRLFHLWCCTSALLQDFGCLKMKSPKRNFGLSFRITCDDQGAAKRGVVKGGVYKRKQTRINADKCRFLNHFRLFENGPKTQINACKREQTKNSPPLTHPAAWDRSGSFSSGDGFSLPVSIFIVKANSWHVLSWSRAITGDSLSWYRDSEGRGSLEEGCLGLPGVFPDISWTAIFPRKWRKRPQELELPDLAWNSQTSFSQTSATTWEMSFLGTEICRSFFDIEVLFLTSNVQDVEAQKHARVHPRKKTISMLNSRMHNLDTPKKISIPKRRLRPPRYHNKDISIPKRCPQRLQTPPLLCSETNIRICPLSSPAPHWDSQHMP